MAIDVDAAANPLLGLSVNTYLEKAEDAVTLTVGFATLPDGTNYNAQTTLDAKGQEHHRRRAEFGPPAGGSVAPAPGLSGSELSFRYNFN